MSRLVCFSSASLHVPGRRSYHKDLHKAMQLKRIDGLEILIAEANRLLKFKFHKDELDFIKSMKFKTLHAPFFMTGKLERLHFKNDPYYKRLLNKLYSMYDQIEADNINFHHNQIDDYNVFNVKDYQHSIENMPPHHKLTIKLCKSLLRKSKFKLVLDATHALAGNELKEFINAFKKDILYLHLSAFEDENDHRFLHRVRKDSLRKLEPVKKLKCPVVVETWTEDKRIRPYQKEIDFVRRWLNS